MKGPVEMFREEEDQKQRAHDLFIERGMGLLLFVIAAFLVVVGWTTKNECWVAVVGVTCLWAAAMMFRGLSHGKAKR